LELSLFLYKHGFTANSQQDPIYRNCVSVILGFIERQNPIQVNDIDNNRSVLEHTAQKTISLGRDGGDRTFSTNGNKI
jgi:hypothetical protein